MLLVWQLTRVQLGSSNYAYFVLSPDVVASGGMNSKHILLDTLTLEQYQIVPAVAVAPIHFWLACKRKTQDRMGIVLLQTGPPTAVMKAAASACFHDLSLTKLKTICAEEGIALDGVPSEASALSARIKTFLGPISDDDVLAILALRGVEPDNPMDILPADVAEEMLD